MQRIQIPVRYDYASTICFVAHRVMERVGAELDTLGVDLVWEPIDLALLMGWPRGHSMEGRRRDNALRVAEELDVAVRMPLHWIDSRPSMAVSLVLAGTAREPTWRERVWTAIHEEGRDPGPPTEVERLARDLGLALEVDALAARRAELEERTREAAEQGVTSLPCFMLAGLPFGGIQQDATMLRLLGRYAKRVRETEPG